MSDSSIRTKPFDRRAVEHDVAIESFLELRLRNLDVLVYAENVGELKAQKANIVLRRRDRECLSCSHRSCQELVLIWMALGSQ